MPAIVSVPERLSGQERSRSGPPTPWVPAQAIIAAVQSRGAQLRASASRTKPRDPLGAPALASDSAPGSTPL